MSSIPVEAIEKRAAGAKRRAEYFLNGERVGERGFHPSGDLDFEYSFRNGVKHGWQYRWDQPGKLLSAEPYENGLAHGTAYQWANDGRLIGTYSMEHGTGIDLWRQDWEDGSVDLTEVRYLRDGARDGFEWWFCKGRRLSSEQHFREDIEHGIERRWEFNGELRSDYPQFWLHGESVTETRYVEACLTDPTLPRFDVKDNLPYRTFPAEIEVHLCSE